MWGPLLGWCVLQLLAESIDPEAPERMALDLFDRLRLREPFAKSFSALGFEGEEGWRVAARIKVVLLSEAGIGKEEARAKAETEQAAEDDAAISAFDAESPAAGVAPAGSDVAAAEQVTTAGQATAEVERVALSPVLWRDPDVRWLTGVHEAKGHAYLVRERYEELLWWMLMPSLLRLAGQAALDRAAIREMGRIVDEALESAEAAGYRIDALLGLKEEDEGEEESQTAEPDAKGIGTEKEKIVTAEVAAEVATGNPPEPVE
jgi:hypothetical protein